MRDQVSRQGAIMEGLSTGDRGGGVPHDRWTFSSGCRANTVSFTKTRKWRSRSVREEEKGCLKVTQGNSAPLHIAAQAVFFLCWGNILFLAELGAKYWQTNNSPRVRRVAPARPLPHQPRGRARSFSHQLHT